MAKKKSSKTSRKPAAAKAVARKPAKTVATAASNGASTVRLARVPKGKRPQYFSDPAIDKLLWATITLAQELSVTRDRLDTVERLLADRKVLKLGAVDAYVPAAPVEAGRESARAAFISRFLRAVEADLVETAGKDNPRTQEEVVAAVNQ